MELLDYFRALKRRWWLVVAVTLVCFGASYYFTDRQQRVYATSVEFYLSNGAGAPVNNLLEQSARSRITTYLKLANSSAARERALTAVTDPAAVGGYSVSGSGDGTTIFMSLSFTAGSPDGVYQIAQAYAATFPGYVTSFERGNPDSGGTTLTVQEQPGRPSSPISPNPRRNYALALALGLVLGAAAALILELLDRSLRSSDEVERISGLPSLASVPLEYKGTTAIASMAPRSQRSEAIRQLRTNVQFASVGTPLRSMLITSAIPGEGKTSVAINLAITSALAGQKVAIVDADLRRPAVAEALGLESSVGLTNLLINEVGLDDALQFWGADAELAVLASGPVPANPSELLGSQRMLDIIGQLGERFELIIFDTPPVLPVTDATVLARLVDGVVLVAMVGSTTRDRLSKAVNSLRKLDVRIVGVVSNGTAGIGDYYLSRGETARSIHRESRRGIRRGKDGQSAREAGSGVRPATREGDRDWDVLEPRP